MSSTLKERTGPSPRTGSSIKTIPLSSLYTQFPSCKGGVSEYACPVAKTPHFAFVRQALAQLALSPELAHTAITGTGYGTYGRFEFATLSGSDCGGYDAEGVLQGQWHSPKKYFELIRELLHSMSNGRGIDTLGIEVMAFEVDERQLYFIIDGAHRAAFLMALLGSAGHDVSIEVTLSTHHIHGLPSPTCLVEEASLAAHLNPYFNNAESKHNRKA